MNRIRFLILIWRIEGIKKLLENYSMKYIQINIKNTSNHEVFFSFLLFKHDTRLFIHKLFETIKNFHELLLYKLPQDFLSSQWIRKVAY